MDQNRLTRLRSLIKKSKLDYLLITDPIDAQYISGFHSSNITLLINSKSAWLFTDFRYKQVALDFGKNNKNWNVEIISGLGYTFLKSHIEPRSKIAFQGNYLSFDSFTKLKKSLKGCSFQSFTDEIEFELISKTEEEIQCISKAAEIGDKAFKKFKKQIYKGMTELEAARLLERICSDFGSERPSFDTIVLFGERAALPHGQPGDRILKKHDWILVDFGCTYKGFCSDMTRTMVAGKASKKQIEIYDIVNTARERAIKTAKDGVMASSLDAIARSFIADSGYGEAFGHGLGHGVGLRIHEKPSLNKHFQLKLPQNSVITIEPGIYIEDFGGVRIEDMIVLEHGACKLITNTSRELIEVDI